MTGKVVEVTIEDIGSSGDGIGHVDASPVYVPLALPGDALTVRLGARRGQGHAADVIESQALMPRHQPVCRHFGTCGGCRLQHLPPPDYRRWKRDRVEAALASRGIGDVEIKPLIDGEFAARRRLRLAFQPEGKGLVFGLRKRLDRRIVAIEECPIAKPAIVRLFDLLRHGFATLDTAVKGGEISITAADNGLDLLLETPIPPSLADREALAGLADAQDLARLAWREGRTASVEPISARRQPIIDFGGVPTALPIGAFLQATSEAERAIRSAVALAIGEARTLADLFAGCGTLGLPFAKEGRKIFAAERDPAMIEALRLAADGSGLGARVDAIARDLDRDPLVGDELAPFEAVIVDPPRAGAPAQVQAIASTASPSRVAMVSCNPATFSRDARTLIEAGYRLSWVQPIDAFLFAAEIELVGAFERAITP